MKKLPTLILSLFLILSFVFSLSLIVNGSREKIIYLTFDDGPTPNTPEILRILEKYNAKATFFVLDDRITKYPDYVKLIDSSGHSIGLHGISHDVNVIYQSPSEPLKEINEENETLYKTLGKRTNLIRTPYGSYPYMTLDQYKILTAANYKIWDWTVDPRDSVGSAPSLSTMLNRIERDLKGTETPIILLHDRKSTTNNLDSILTYLSDKGYIFKCLDEKMDPVNFMELYGPAKNKSS